MSHPTDTLNFDVVPAGVSSITPINIALAQLSYAISMLKLNAANQVIKIPITAGISMLARNAAYLNPSDGLMYPIDADAAPALAGTIRGFVEASVSVSSLGSLVIAGVVGGFSGLIPWQPVYADTTGAGTITQIRPCPLLDTGQMAIVPIGMAISATKIVVMPSFMDCRIRYQKRYSPVLDQTVTLQHGVNPDAFAREFTAYITQNAILTQYASSNQDINVPLKGPSGTGGLTTVDTVGATVRTLGDNAGSEYRVAQSFQPANAGILSQFTVSFGANSGSPAGVVTWKICSDNAGLPGPVLQSGTFTPTPSSNNTVNVSGGVFLLALIPYWLVLEAPAQATGAAWQVNVNTANPYANGLFKQDQNSAGTWVVVASALYDLRCTITTTALTSKDKLAQGFQISSASTVSRVRLWLKKIGSPTGNMTVKIQTDNAGNPSGTTVTNGTSATVSGTSLSTSYDYHDFLFSAPPSLSTSTQYHLVLETTSAISNTNWVEWGADNSAPGYTNGVMKSEESSTWVAASADGVFQVISTELDYSNEVNVDWWSSTKADMVAQAGDISGANTDTNTTFKCKYPSGFEDITVEVVL